MEGEGVSQRGVLFKRSKLGPMKLNRLVVLNNNWSYWDEILNHANDYPAAKKRRVVDVIE